MKKIFSILLIIVFFNMSANSTDNKESLPFGLIDNHLNLVYSASNIRKTEIFYGEILNLKRISDVILPGNRVMLRYIAGESELKFIINENEKPKKSLGMLEAKGIRQLSILLPDSKRLKIIDKLNSNDIKISEIIYSDNKSNSLNRFLINDFDGNRVEILFSKNDLSNSTSNQTHIGIGVSSIDEMADFLYNILDFNPVITEGMTHSYDMGLTRVKFWETPYLSPSNTGMPHEILGMSMIQFIITDVRAVRDVIVSRGGKIHTEPYLIGDLAIIMIVEGPDGILFEFGAAL